MKKRFIPLLLVFSLMGCASEAAEVEPEKEITLELAQQYLSEGNYQEAIAAFSALIEIEPRNILLYMGRADAYVSISEYTLASDDYTTVIEIDDSTKDALAYRAILNYVNQHKEDGEADLNHLTEMTEDSEEMNREALQFVKDFLERLEIPMIKEETGEGINILVYEMPDGTRLVFIDLDGAPFVIKTIDAGEEMPDDLLNYSLTNYLWKCPEESFPLEIEFHDDGSAIMTFAGEDPAPYTWYHVDGFEEYPEGVYYIAEGSGTGIDGAWTGMVGFFTTYEGKRIMALHSHNLPVALDGLPLMAYLPE